MSDRIAMIGHPVAGVKSPALFNARFASLGLPMRMETVDVPPERLADYLAAFRDDPALAGVVSTAPHKAALADFADRLGPSAQRLGLANALRLGDDGAIEGEMFDGHAFRACIAQTGMQMRGKAVGIIGFGAAGRACAIAAEDLGATRIFACDTNRGMRAHIEAAGYRWWWSHIGPPGTEHAVDVVVNATPSPLEEATVRWLCTVSSSPALTVLDLAASGTGSLLVQEANGVCAHLIDGGRFAAAQFGALWAFLVDGTKLD